MAEAGAIQQLRENIGDAGNPPAYEDAELGALLDSNGGVEPRARVAALLPLWAEAAGRTDYNSGSSAEKVSQAFGQLEKMLAQAQTEVAALATSGRVRDAARATGAGTGTSRVEVQW